MTATIYDRLTSSEMVTDFDAFMAKAKTAKGIIEQVSNQTMIPVRDLLGKKRDQPTAHARQLCFYRIHYECNYSLSEIGRLFGRDHTTVLHGIRREEQRQKQDAIVRQKTTMSMTLQEAVTKWPFAASDPNDVKEATQLEATISAHMMAHRRKDKRAGPIGKLPAGEKMDNADKGVANRTAVWNNMDDGPNRAAFIGQRIGKDTSAVTCILQALERRGYVKRVTIPGSVTIIWHKLYPNRDLLDV